MTQDEFHVQVEECLSYTATLLDQIYTLATITWGNDEKDPRTETLLRTWAVVEATLLEFQVGKFKQPTRSIIPNKEDTLHFWFSASFENQRSGVLKPVYCVIDGVRKRYSYCNCSQTAAIHPGLRDSLDLQYLGCGDFAPPKDDE